MSYASTILGTTGLVGYWRLGESAGTSAVDAQNANNGTYTGTYTLAQTQRIVDADTAVRVGPTTAGYIAVPDSTPLTITGALSAEIWAKFMDNTPTFQIFWGFYNPSSFTGWAVVFNGTNAGAMGYYSSAHGWEYSTGLVNDGAWHHIVLTVSAGGTAKFYIDGGTPETLAATAAPAHDTGGHAIGALSDGGNRTDAFLDEAALYNVELDAATVTAHYLAGVGSGGPAAPVTLGNTGAIAGGNSTPWTLNTTATVPSAGFITAAVSWYGAGITVAVSGGGLTWILDKQQNGSLDSGRHVAIFSAQAPTGLASATTLTATPSGSVNNKALAASYTTGVALASPVDITGGGTGTTTAWTTGAVTTTSANDLLIAACHGDFLATSTPGANEIHDFQNATDSITLTDEYSIEPAAGSKTLTGTWSAVANEWLAAVVAYKVAAAPQILRPDADNAAASWGTTPLWSKLNDQSDATVVSDTLA